jgi:hypothetical protein
MPAAGKRPRKADASAPDFTISVVEKPAIDAPPMPSAPELDLRSFFSMPCAKKADAKPAVAPAPATVSSTTTAAKPPAPAATVAADGDDDDEDDEDDNNNDDNDNDNVDEEVVDLETGSSYHRVVKSIRDKTMPVSSSTPTGIMRYRNVKLAEIPNVCSDFPYENDPYTGACWWDGERFDGSAVCIPCSFDMKQKRFSQWHGAFCGWACAMAYAHANMPKTTHLLWQLRQATTGDAGLVPRAPHFSELTRYGGHMTLAQFRNSN